MKKNQKRQRPPQPKSPKQRRHSAHGREKQNAARAAAIARAAARKREQEHIDRTEEMMILGHDPEPRGAHERPRFGSRPYWMDSGRHG